jgi:hypothetical protein
MNGYSWTIVSVAHIEPKPIRNPQNAKASLALEMTVIFQFKDGRSGFLCGFIISYVDNSRSKPRGALYPSYTHQRGTQSLSPAKTGAKSTFG